MRRELRVPAHTRPHLLYKRAQLKIISLTQLEKRIARLRLSTTTVYDIGQLLWTRTTWDKCIPVQGLIQEPSG